MDLAKDISYYLFWSYELWTRPPCLVSYAPNYLILSLRKKKGIFSGLSFTLMGELRGYLLRRPGLESLFYFPMSTFLILHPSFVFFFVLEMELMKGRPKGPFLDSDHCRYRPFSLKIEERTLSFFSGLSLLSFFMHETVKVSSKGKGRGREVRTYLLKP